LAEQDGNATRIHNYTLNGELCQGGPDAWVASLSWSPDGRELLIRIGPLNASGRVERYLVVDAATGHMLVGERQRSVDRQRLAVSAREGLPPLSATVVSHSSKALPEH
jgi:hypothetical protein